MVAEFFQDAPGLTNQYDDDPLLASYLRQRLPPKMIAEIEPSLRRLGGRAAGELLALDAAAEAQPPRHVPYDAWGRRIDAIPTSHAWRELDRETGSLADSTTAPDHRYIEFFLLGTEPAALKNDPWRMPQFGPLVFF